MKILHKVQVLPMSVVLLLAVQVLCANLIKAENVQFFDPLGLVLTWQQDPTSTMTIDWHTTDDGRSSTLEYKKVEDEEWETATGEYFPYPASDLIPLPESDRVVRRVELTGLEADTEFHFRFGENSRIRKFRTMPVEATRPIRFATGGDVRHRIEWMEQTNRRVASYEPDFIVWGGDLAYGDGRRLERWYEYLDAMMNTLVTADGRVIPVLAGIGNHEVIGGTYNREDHHRRERMGPYAQDDDTRKKIAPYFYSFFAFPGQPGYNVLDFGDYMSIILLDTNHTNPVNGQQTQWLESVLAERRDVPHIFPAYHVPAWPSVRNVEGVISSLVRENWVPLFEEYGLRVVFENHDHAYKRTYPIRNGSISPDGIVYIGDGAWGVSTREIGRDHENHAWYLKRVASERHFILGTIHGNHQHFLVVNEGGEIIDEYPRTPHFDLQIKRLAQPWQPPAVGHDDANSRSN